MKKKLLIITETILITQLVLSVVSLVSFFWLDIHWIGFRYIFQVLMGVFPYGLSIIFGVVGAFEDAAYFYGFTSLYIALLIITIFFIFLAYRAKRLWLNRLLKMAVCVLMVLDTIGKVVVILPLDDGVWWLGIIGIILSIAIIAMVTIALNRNEGTPLNKPIDLSRL